MIVPFASILALTSLAAAVPYKRYDNATENSLAALGSSVELDTTVFINEFVTITLPSTTLTLDAASTSAIASAEKAASVARDVTVTSVITEFATLTIDGSEVTSPVATLTSTYAQGPTTTSTITNVVTITMANGSVTTEAIPGSACVPSTVTVTVTEKPTDTSSVLDNAATVTETITTSYPVVAEFTLSDITTTITSYVEVTTYETSLSSLSLASTVPVNGTYEGYQRLRRGLVFNF